jgi:hypothetical protein
MRPATLSPMPRGPRRKPQDRSTTAQSWYSRYPVLGTIPGDRSYLLEDLARLLELVGDGLPKDDVITWPTPEAQVSVSKAIMPIARSGLFRREGQSVKVSEQGRAWLAHRDPYHLIEIFHDHVRFVGEILNELKDGPASQRRLLVLGRDKYGFGWTTPGPVHNRIKWMAAAGVVQTYSHAVHLTDGGRELLSRLAVYEPQTGISDPTDLRPAPAAIDALLKYVNENPGARHRAGGLHVPGLNGPVGIKNIRSVVEACARPTETRTLMDKAIEVFGFGDAGASAVISSLKIIGVIKRASADEWVATPEGAAWITTGYDIDLARIMHSNVWFFGEIVRELELSGRLTFSELIHRSSNYSLNGRYEPIKRGAMTSRMALLEATGLIVDVGNKYFKSTPLGKAFRRSVPEIDPIDTTSAAPPGEIVDDTAADDLAEPANTPAVDISTETVETINPLSAAGSADSIAHTLLKAAKRSDKSVELELAAVAAFRFLGYPATHVGGNGEPDGIVRTRPGKLGSVYTIETKSASNGVVPEEQAKPATLTEHREQHDADATVYIGPGFERRLLEVIDGNPRIAVVSTALISEAVIRQANTPLTAEELEPLIDPSLREADRRDQLMTRWKAKEEWALAMRGVIEVLSREAESPMSDDDSSSLGAGWLDITSVRRSLRDVLNRDVARETVTDVLGFLVSPQVSVAETLDDRYRLKIALEAIPRHFDYLGRRWQVGDNLYQLKQ